MHSTDDKLNNGIGRREFMLRMTALASLAAAYPASSLAELRAKPAHDEPAPWLYKDPWKTIAAVQEHLFPAGDDAPGAGDIRATHYLYAAVGNPAADGEDREFIINGAGWLNELGHENYQKAFIDLDEQQRETLLREIEDSRAGSNWLSLLLTYLMEALLADPVYGGNPGGIGWKWLQHQPGFPAPLQDKTWYRLAAPAVHFRRKA